MERRHALFTFKKACTMEFVTAKKNGEEIYLLTFFQLCQYLGLGIVDLLFNE
jgi:hypothetical protein